MDIWKRGETQMFIQIWFPTLQMWSYFFRPQNESTISEHLTAIQAANPGRAFRLAQAKLLEETPRG